MHNETYMKKILQFYIHIISVISICAIKCDLFKMFLRKISTKFSIDVLKRKAFFDNLRMIENKPWMAIPAIIRNNLENAVIVNKIIHYKCLISKIMNPMVIRTNDKT